MKVTTESPTSESGGRLGLPHEVCERACRSRDPRFDGRFFIAVSTTRIFCRPICPAPRPLAKNITFYPTAASAFDAGYRPCLRCRPETAPGTPAWSGTAACVSRALRLIDAGALDEGSVEELAARVGMTGRHLGRLFQRHVGAPPGAVARTRRLLFAKLLLTESELAVADVAFAAGFRSLRRFNAAFLESFRRPPREVRRDSRLASENRHGLRLRLNFRPPYEWDRILAFLSARAIPGVEEVGDGVYRRVVKLGERAGRIEIRQVEESPALEMALVGAFTGGLLGIVGKARRLFDLDADPAGIAAHLSRDRRLAPLVQRRPGLRLPGAWDGFETAVRAVLGQQVSVAGATTLSGRIVERWGEAVEELAGSGPHRLFPTPAVLAKAPIESIGLPGARAAALKKLAAEVASGRLCLDSGVDPETTVNALQAIPGIGPWTAQYVAMRVFGEPDAFPASDLGLLRALEVDGRRPTVQEVEEAAESWRPWRAYAAMHLWQLDAGKSAATKPLSAKTKSSKSHKGKSQTRKEQRRNS